jgi:hypothetical protein
MAYPGSCRRSSAKAPMYVTAESLWRSCPLLPATGTARTILLGVGAAGLGLWTRATGDLQPARGREGGIRTRGLSVPNAAR